MVQKSEGARCEDSKIQGKGEIVKSQYNIYTAVRANVRDSSRKKSEFEDQHGSLAYRPLVGHFNSTTRRRCTHI